MKQLCLILVCSVLFFTETTMAQNFPNMDKSPMDISAYPSSYRESNKIVKVIYSRPQLKGRSVSSLAKPGKVWRTGANEAPEIIFYKDVVFGGKAVKAGTYSLFTIPNEGKWTIILSTAKNVWGAYMYDKSEDVVRVEGKVSQLPKSTEAFSIAFDGEGEAFNMYLGWGKIAVTLPIKG